MHTHHNNTRMLPSTPSAIVSKKRIESHLLFSQTPKFIPFLSLTARPAIHKYARSQSLDLALQPLVLALLRQLEQAAGERILLRLCASVRRSGLCLCERPEARAQMRHRSSNKQQPKQQHNNARCAQKESAPHLDVLGQVRLLDVAVDGAQHAARARLRLGGREQLQRRLHVRVLHQHVLVPQAW
jgi:hypothetical protein